MADKFSMDIPWATGGSPPSAKYCNSVTVLFSPWEFNFEFSQLIPVLQQAEGGAEGAAPVVNVQITKQIHEFLAMSPQHAKAFLNALEDNVSKYEAQFGEIPDVPLGGSPANG